MEFEKSEFAKFVKKELETNGKQIDQYGIRNSVSHHKEKPFDCFDRLFALFLIEIKSNLLDVSISEMKTIENAKEWYETLSDVQKEEQVMLFGLSYENYEREGLSIEEALLNLINVAQKGREAVSTDSYYDGGWFGAS